MFLAFFASGWQQKLGYGAILSAVLSILLLSTRAFYLGLAMMLVTLLVFALLRYMVMKKKGSLVTIARWAGLFVLAIILYAVAQHFIFPKNTDTIWNTSIISRLSSISPEESSTHARLGSWARTIKLIGEYPVTGVGTGNWKVEVLKYENPDLNDFTYMYKNHNDFLEITAETGLPGGLTYLAIFILILFVFTKAAMQPLPDGDKLKLLFLPAFGILAYSVDAFFNFPADRPEIQTLFAIYVASAVVFSGSHFSIKNSRQTYLSSGPRLKTMPFQKLVGYATILVLGFSSYILLLFSQSLHYQRLVKEDIQQNMLTQMASTIIEGFPAIPDISAHGEPIAANKARYLIKENRNDEAIVVLKADRASPYDTRRELFIALAYINKGIDDSAIVYLRKVYQLKPFYKDATMLLSTLLFKNNQQQEGMKIMDQFAHQMKTNSEAWLKASDMYLQTGQQEKALIILDSALHYLSEDTAIINRRNSLSENLKIAPYEDLFNRIVLSMQSKKYSEAIELLTEFIRENPVNAEAYANRAYCENVTGRFTESIKDIDQAYKLGMVNYNLLNLRGENFRRLGNMESACRDFQEAMKKGDAAAAINYQKYCNKK